MAIKQFNTADYRKKIYEPKGSKKLAVGVNGHTWIFTMPPIGVTRQLELLRKKEDELREEFANAQDKDTKNSIKYKQHQLLEEVCGALATCLDDKGDGSVDKWLNRTDVRTAYAMLMDIMNYVAGSLKKEEKR